MLRYLLIGWLAALAVADWSDEPDDDTVELEGVDAVLGRSAELPCNIEPSHREDRVYMVLWFRQGASKPLYRFDVRGRPFNQALLWSDANAFGPRAYFVTGKRPVAALQLESVQLKDAGIYRCRVDFRNSPTRNFQVKLAVIVPPHQLLVFDNAGQVLNDVVGPLVEDADLLLTCEVRGGEPAPEVSWSIDERPVPGKLEKAGANVLVNKLSVTSVKRQHLNTTFKCQASNTNLMQPSEKTVRLEMFLKPTRVGMREKPTVMVAEHEYSLVCEAWGSRPQAQLTWLRENSKFRRGKVEVWQNESVVISKLVFSPAPEDDGHSLKCQAINPSLQAPPLDDSITLNVVYAPLVSLQLGTSLKPHQIKEGDDVYFECNVRANPKQHKIAWFHNGDVVNQNVSTGVLFSTQSLVLQGVTRQNAGKYTCSATNNRGHTTSQPVQLRIQFAPVCLSGEGVMVGASLDEAVKVRCVVSADPDDVTFIWQFNNSGESFPVAPTRFASGNGTVSELVYTPSSERDYGTLACWATNSIGRQTEPCTFHVVQATKPGAVHNCTTRSAVNTTGDWLEVECIAGFDGGLAQTFHLEAVDTLTSKHCLNASNPDGPFFRVELATLTNGLPGTIQLVMYSSNPKGRSELLVLEDVAIRDAEKRTDWTGNGERLRTGGVVALLVGGLVTVGSISGVVALCALRRRAQGRRHILGPISHTTKQVEITAGGDDQRYVVSYQLKPETKQPDILTRVSDDPFERSATHGNHNGSGITTFVSVGECAQYKAMMESVDSDPPLAHNGLQAVQHSLSNSIPGPESCV